jgi:hypothetical protein
MYSVNSVRLGSSQFRGLISDNDPYTAGLL